MSLSTELHAIAARLEGWEETAVSDFEAVKATPVGGQVLALVAKLARYEAASVLPAGVGVNLLATLQGFENLAAPYITAYEQRQAAQGEQAQQQATA